jgi:hypothetical protein
VIFQVLEEIEEDNTNNNVTIHKLDLCVLLDSSECMSACCVR